MRRDFREVSAVVQAPVAASWAATVPALLLLAGAILLLYRDTALAMVRVWTTSETFAHAIVVPPVVLWLVWRERHALLAQAPNPTARVLPLIAAAGVLWLLGELAAVNAASQFALMSMLVLAIVAVLGWGATRVILFPLGFLFFAVPLGEFMMPRLMLWTADFTTFALRLSGVPVFREGQQIVVPTGIWSVVEACSGIRYLIASVMVGTLFAYLNYRSLRRRLVFVGVSIVVPIVANWMRAYLIVMLGHLSENRIAAGVDHLIYGWVFFGVVIMLMFLVGARWREPQAATAAPEAAPATRSPSNAGPAAVWSVAGPACVLLLAPLLADHVLTRSEEVSAPVLSAAPALGGWRPAGQAFPAFRPIYRDPSAEVDQVYTAGEGRQVGLYVGYYRQQNQHRKLVSAQNVLVASDDPTWLQVASARRTVEVDGRQVPVRTAQLRAHRRSTDRLVVWQLYWINGTLTTGDVRAKVYGALHRLAGRGDDAASIVLYTPVKDGAGEPLLEEFLRGNLAALTAQLQAARDGD